MADFTCGGGAAVRKVSAAGPNIAMQKSYEENYGRIPFDVFDYIRSEHGIDMATVLYCFSDRGVGYYYKCHSRHP